jgi:hypothetical protein
LIISLFFLWQSTPRAIPLSPLNLLIYCLLTFSRLQCYSLNINQSIKIFGFDLQGKVRGFVSTCLYKWFDEIFLVKTGGITTSKMTLSNWSNTCKVINKNKHGQWCTKKQHWESRTREAHNFSKSNHFVFILSISLFISKVCTPATFLMAMPQNLPCLFLHNSY